MGHNFVEKSGRPIGGGKCFCTIGHQPPSIQELGRGERSLRYHGFASVPLVIIAYLARANGVDLFSQEGLSAPGPALPKLVKVVLRLDNLFSLHLLFTASNNLLGILKIPRAYL
jgi:hypothetical protein